MSRDRTSRMATGMVALVVALVFIVISIACTAIDRRANQGFIKLAVVEYIERSSDPDRNAARARDFVAAIDLELTDPTYRVTFIDLEESVRRRIAASSLLPVEKVVVDELAVSLLDDFQEGMGADFDVSVGLNDTQVAQARRVLLTIRSAVDLTGR